MKLVLVLIVIGLLASCTPAVTELPIVTPDPAVEQRKQDNYRLLAKAVAPVIVVSVTKQEYRTVRSKYTLYDVKARDKNGNLFVFTATDWAGLTPGYVIKPESIVVDGGK
jgi:hypothetical protein